MLKTYIEGERFLHRELWRVVDRQLKHASINPEGAFYDRLVAMVFAFHTLEAYLNFVGERLAPDIWRDERNYFRNEPYRGFDGKLKKVFELVGMPESDPNKRPCSTVGLLKALRDLIGHAKPEKFKRTVEHEPHEKPDFLNTPLDEIVTPENAVMARDDIKILIDRIHAEASKRGKKIDFHEEALDGSLQHGRGYTREVT